MARTLLLQGRMMNHLEESLHAIEAVLVEHPELHDVFETWALACIDEWTELQDPGPPEVIAPREKLHIELAKATWAGSDLLMRARRTWLEYVLDALDETEAPQRHAA